MSVLIRDLKQQAPDYPWIADDSPVPASGNVMISLDRWKLEAEQLRNAGLSVGIRLANSISIPDVWALISGQPLLCLEFPSFGDGRAYSQAKVLRERYSFQGEIRASGAAVVHDQLSMMQRVGINAFELREEQDAAECLKLLSQNFLSYQPNLDGSKADQVQALRRSS